MKKTFCDSCEVEIKETPYTLMFCHGEDVDIVVEDLCADCRQAIRDMFSKKPVQKIIEKPKTGRKLVDRGKVMALHNAGWTVEQIVDEMKCSDFTVKDIIRAEKKKAVPA